jgi:ATP-dependent metalloprotease FtsH
MDDKAGRRKSSEVYRRRLGQARSYRRKVWRLAKEYKNALFTSFLLLIVVVLLFGIFSQLKPPTTISTTPSGVTTIDYSTFVKQVTNGNVLAVTVRGNEINALLANPLDGKVNASEKTKPTSQSVMTDYAAWSRYIGFGNASLANPNASTNASIDASRAVYTLIPTNGDDQLFPLLLQKHVIVNTLPATQSATWLTLVWKFLPIVFLIIFLLIFLAARNGARSMRSTDDRVTQMGKSRARRFERAKEASTPSSATTKASPISRNTPNANANSKLSPARVSTEIPVTFADVAGIDEVRTELEEIVQFLRAPERFDRLGARIPRGALLVGPPGTGKTLLAKAVAGEAHVPFFSISASEFVEMFVGIGASRVRDLFNQARQAAPCVIFIDEIDAVGRKRSMRVAGNDERDQTLNQLLVELDGFDARKAIVVLAATNRVDILDKALLRPGRFDRRITVSMPDRAGREAILNVHTRKTPLHSEVSLERLARMTTGMTGADLANLVNEAALTAARRDLELITHDCFEDALARVQLGALRPLVMSEKERQIIAVHEGGHALVAYHLPEADTVNRVTILPRGQSLGVTQFTAEEDRYNYSRETLMARIAVGLGGRVAEELTFGSDRITTGAENDLQVVTDLARRMVTRWGMSEQVGVVFADYQAEGDYSLNMRQIDPGAVSPQARSLVAHADGSLQVNGVPSLQQRMWLMSTYAARSTAGAAMNAVIDAEVQRILNEGKAIARQILVGHANQLELLTDALLLHEQLDRHQFESLLNGSSSL